MWTLKSVKHSYSDMFHSFSKPEGALAQKVQNGLIWEVTVTFDRHPAIAVAKPNNKHKT